MWDGLMSGMGGALLMLAVDRLLPKTAEFWTRVGIGTCLIAGVNLVAIAAIAASRA